MCALLVCMWGKQRLVEQGKLDFLAVQPVSAKLVITSVLETKVWATPNQVVPPTVTTTGIGAGTNHGCDYIGMHLSALF